MARCRISSDIARAQHQRMHPAAVPLCRVVKHAREWGATLAPLRILRFGDNPERLPLREIRSPLSSPGGPKAGHTIIFAGLSRPVHPGGSIPWSLPWPVRDTQSVAAATHCIHGVGAWQTSWALASKVKGGSGTRHNVHQPRRKPASHHGRDAGLVPEPPLFTKAYQRGHDCTTMLDMAGRTLCTLHA